MTKSSFMVKLFLVPDDWNW